MYYANSFLIQLLPNKAKKVRYAPQKTPFSNAERGFAILDITITLLCVHNSALVILHFSHILMSTKLIISIFGNLTLNFSVIWH